MAINEQTKKAKVLFISTSQSDEISAKPDTSPITFHEALNPTITSRVVGSWVMKNLGQKWWIVYADYAWGKQNNMVLTETNKKLGGTILGSTPYPLGSAEFSAHLPKIQAAKPDVLMAVTPGADDIAFLKQVKSFGMHQQMKIAKPLHWISVAKQGGPELYQDVYGGINFYWELQDSIPEAKRYVEAFQKKFNIPPGDYGVYSYSAVLEVARGSELGNLATELDALAVTGDLADSAIIERLVHETQQRYGRVDAVVNNTGHAAKGDLLTLTDEDWHRGLDLLLLNVIRLARLVTPIMLAQKRSGAFVNISSFVALEPSLSFPVSATIRAGLGAFTKLYVQQYGSRGLRMNNVLPGRIDTYPVSMEDLHQIPLARPGTADDVARVVAFLLSEDAAYIAGQDILVDGGLVRTM